MLILLMHSQVCIFIHEDLNSYSLDKNLLMNNRMIVVAIISVTATYLLIKDLWTT